MEGGSEETQSWLSLKRRDQTRIRRPIKCVYYMDLEKPSKFHDAELGRLIQQERISSWWETRLLDRHGNPVHDLLEGGSAPIPGVPGS
jgi:hypothetical protein